MQLILGQNWDLGNRAQVLISPNLNWWNSNQQNGV
jgi:hypothetical protein